MRNRGHKSVKFITSLCVRVPFTVDCDPVCCDDVVIAYREYEETIVL